MTGKLSIEGAALAERRLPIAGFRLNAEYRMLPQEPQ
jgi:hypothetical protein